MAQFPNVTREVKSTEVIVRFCLRMVILVVFAAFGSVGFDRSLTALLWMSTILSAVLATLEREHRSPPSSTTGTRRRLTRRCAAWSAGSIAPFRFETATFGLMRFL